MSKKCIFDNNRTYRIFFNSLEEFKEICGHLRDYGFTLNGEYSIYDYPLACLLTMNYPDARFSLLCNNLNTIKVLKENYKKGEELEITRYKQILKQ